MMKKFLFMSFAALLAAAGLTSCDDDDDVQLYYSYVTVDQATSNDLILRKDGGAYLTTKRTYVPVGYLEEGDRVVVYYEIPGDPKDATGDQDIYIWDYSTILTKDPLLYSEVDEAGNEDDYGYDAIHVFDAWFGGEYLNINFSLIFDPRSTTKHYINLIADDAEYDPAENELYVYLRHNAYGEKPGVNYLGQANLREGRGMVSFNMVNLLDELEGIDPDVILVWENYDGNNWTDPLVEHIEELGKFTAWTVDQSASTNSADYELNESAME